ncbi:uncharacterized protein OCT59_017508 [Rhizophagus irregularis]|uniref:HAUS augmin-like complex subunit 1 n=1 Tax=Rhizophagus irregularis (strain DAOM 197198w) TaxID=1432141 RepID=A0A015KGH3_RHIIW|nr:hypothetical protein RirG_195520 [Rhizophagus irregularis DAOM 197198w]UZO25231.1 hypothetical protein OCT59_017508 [Rhizophagus irregularis]GBC46377.1 HAUS augmin-like complex subunit 1 [Rhizophagus irregularis DAOM 181602=DAOM 197198]
MPGDIEDALSSVFLNPSTPSYMPEDSYFTSVNPEETYAHLLNDSSDKNENNVSEAEKWEFIDSWLKSHFKDKRVPLFEKNSAVASALYEMALFNKQQDTMTEIIIKRQKIQAMEYRSEAKRIKDILETMRLSKDDLSKNGVHSLKTLTSLAIILGLANTEQSSYLSALAQLNLDILRAERNNNAIVGIIESMETRIQKAKSKNEKLDKLLYNLRKSWDSKEEEELRKWEKNMDLLLQKGKEYQDRIMKLERKYNELNVEEGGLRFKVLKKKEDYINYLEQEIGTKKAKLKTYQIMPPDIILAKLKTDEAKQKLDELKELHTELIYKMADNFQ